MSSVLAVPIDEARDHLQGAIDAPITLVEYGDYECPYCGQAFPVVKELQRELATQIRFIYRQLPLAQLHPHAQRAAYAAEAAGLQGKFWQMHDLLYDNQAALYDASLVVYADVIGLNLQQFAKDMESPEVAQRVQEDFMGGIRSGVNGTPCFFVNGRRYDGPYTYSGLQQALTASAGVQI